MTTWWFDLDAGADANPGTEESPKKNPNSVTFSAYDVVKLRRGTFNTAPSGTSAIDLSAGGIVVEAYGLGAVPKILGSQVSRGITVNNVAGCSIKDLWIDDVSGLSATRYGVVVTTAGSSETVSSDTTLERVKVTNVLTNAVTGCNGIMMWGDGNTVLECEVDTVGTDCFWFKCRNLTAGRNIARNPAQDDDVVTPGGDCYQFSGTGFDYTNLHFFDNFGDHSNTDNTKNCFITIGVIGTGIIIEGNTFLANNAAGQVNVYIDLPAGSIVRNNRIIGGDYGLYLVNAGGNIVYGNRVENANYGIRLASSARGQKVWHNVIKSCGTGFYGSADDATTELKNTVLKDNTTGLLRHIHMVEDNNDFFGNGTDATYTGGAGSLGAHSITADPLLDDADYPAQNSPLMGAGVDVGITAGADGYPFSSPPPVGAYQWHAAVGAATQSAANIVLRGEPLYLVEMTAAVDAAGNTTVLRATTARNYATEPDDSPANTPYLTRVKTAGLLRRDIAAPGRIAGANQVGYGLVDLVNPDGGLDAWVDYGFDGRDITIRYGREGDRYRDFLTILRGTMDQPQASVVAFQLRVRDRLGELDKPLLTTKYAGTNSLPDGLEGVEDIEGRVKPRLYGSALNFTPALVNTSRLIYQISDAAIASATVYDQGVTLTAGAIYTSQSDMETNAPTAGQVRVWPAGGYFRLGSSPAGQITCDASQGAAVANRTPAQLSSQIAQAAGIAAADISSADVSALDTAAGYECGLWLQEESSAMDAISALMQSIGAWFGFDRLGVLRMGRLTAPGTAVFTLQPYQIITLDRRASDDGGAGLPAWQVTLNYARNYTVQRDADLAGSVSATRRQFVREAVRSVSAADTAIKNKHRLAADEKFETELVSRTNAAAEAARRLALIKVERAMYVVRARVSESLITAADLGVSCAVNVSRFALASKTLRIVGLQHDSLRGSISLTLWG